MSDTQELTRVTVNLIPKAAEALDHAAALDRMSKTDTINRAVQIYDYLIDKGAHGYEILIAKPEERREGLYTVLKLL